MGAQLCFGWISLCQRPSDKWVGLWAPGPGQAFTSPSGQQGAGAGRGKGKKAYHLLVTDAGLQPPGLPLPTPAAHCRQEARQPPVNTLPGPPAWQGKRSPAAGLTAPPRPPPLSRGIWAPTEACPLSLCPVGSVRGASHCSHLPMQAAWWWGRAPWNRLPAWEGGSHAQAVDSRGQGGLGPRGHSHTFPGLSVLASSSPGHLRPTLALLAQLPGGIHRDTGCASTAHQAAGGLSCTGASPKVYPPPQIRASGGPCPFLLPRAPLRVGKGLISMQNRKPGAQEASCPQWGDVKQDRQVWGRAEGWRGARPADSPGSKCELKAKLGLKKDDDMARASSAAGIPRRAQRSGRPRPRPAPRHRPSGRRRCGARPACRAPERPSHSHRAGGVRGADAGGGRGRCRSGRRRQTRRLRPAGRGAAGLRAGAVRKHWRERARGGTPSPAGGARRREEHQGKLGRGDVWGHRGTGGAQKRRMGNSETRRGGTEAGGGGRSEAEGARSWGHGGGRVRGGAG